jgi:hypothetical protein
MQAKLLMHWNIRSGSEAEYFEFLVHELIPSMGKLGLRDIEVWFTAYGDCEQILVSGLMETAVSINNLVASDAWAKLTDGLLDLVDDYAEKVITGGKGFQF